MAVPGTMGKVVLIDLATQEVTDVTPSDDIYLKYLGGYGLGAYFLYEMQSPGVDAMGPDNHLGFFTGLLTGTTGITANRYVVVNKSPKTGTWGDANSGGEFGPAMKRGGFDGVIFKGISPAPVNVVLTEGRVEFTSADEWLGLDCAEVDAKTREIYGKRARSACVGPAGERQSLLSCIINDRGRAAGRGGVGAVMGSKKIKAIIAHGDMEVTMADAAGMKVAIRKHREYLRSLDMYTFFNQYGTAGMTAGACSSGDTPIKNWGGVPDDFPTAGKISDDNVIAYEKKTYGCWRCPISCGGESVVKDGQYASESHKPEYETLGAFGTMCLNDDVESIHKCNEICNKMGLDTISAACTVAFAIECYENGLITDEDTGGLKLTWGNHEAIVEVTRQIGAGEGFGGRVLADGAKVAAERIGKGAEKYAIHVGGEELPMHDPRLNPGLATTYKMDATPGRHTQMGAWTVEGGMVPAGLLPQEEIDAFDKHDYSSKGKAHCVVMNHHHVSSAAGLCLFAWIMCKHDVLNDSLALTTGHSFTDDDVQQIGARIAALRTAFNIREGVRNIDLDTPGRSIGQPPLAAGPLEGITVDLDAQVTDFCNVMGWDPKTGIPTKETLEGLGLEKVAADLHS